MNSSSTETKTKTETESSYLTEPFISHLYSFPHQVSGHASILRLSSQLLLKPLIPAEYSIYETIFRTCNSKNFQMLRSFLPGYFSRIGAKLFFQPKDSSISIDQAITESEDPNFEMDIDLSILSDPTIHVEIPKGKYIKNGGIILKGPVDLGKLQSSNFYFQATISPLLVSSPVIRRIKMKRLKDREKSSARVEFPVNNCIPESWNNKKFAFDLREILVDGSPSFQYIIMENLISQMDTPVIIDLKLGVRQHSDDAKPEKVKRQIKKCKTSTSYSHGIRFGGCQYHNQESNSFVCLDKYFGRKAKTEDLERMIWNFFSKTADIDPPSDSSTPSTKRYRLNLVPFYMNRIKELSNILSGLDSCRFFSASVLLMYDASSPDLLPPATLTTPETVTTSNSISSSSTTTEKIISSPLTTPDDSHFHSLHSNIENGKKSVPFPRLASQDIRLVDFAHSYCDYHMSGPDNGILFGLANLYNILEKLLHTHGKDDPEFAPFINSKLEIPVNLQTAYKESLYSIHSPDASH